MKRIVVLGDSLALPRKEGVDNLNWEETWPYLLERKLKLKFVEIEVINCSKRARLMTTLLGHDFKEHILFKDPEIVILQIGVVDCAPRIISLKEKAVLNHRLFPSFIRRKIIAYRKRNKREITKQTPLAKVYTPPRVFESALKQFFSRVDQEYSIQKKRVIVLPILANIHFMQKSSPNYGDNVLHYNQILQQVSVNVKATFVNIAHSFNRDADNFCSDGYHLNEKGNRSIAEVLSEVISND